MKSDFPVAIQFSRFFACQKNPKMRMILCDWLDPCELWRRLSDTVASPSPPCVHAKPSVAARPTTNAEKNVQIKMEEGGTRTFQC